MGSTVDYGIDLGTTNSCIATWENGAVRVFQNNDQMNVTPSAVHILKTGRMIIGRRARAALLTDPENVAIEFKRWMGQKDRKSFPASHRVLAAEELSSEILKSLKEDVRRQSGRDVGTAVITVPAAFGALQCEATARAAQLAGFSDAPLLQEPIAAAIGYGIKPESVNQKWLVFDLGGGTLDIAVVSTRDGRLSVLEHRGNNLLGGKDIDRLIVEQTLLPVLNSKYDLRDKSTRGSLHSLLPRLRAKAEEAKIDLSSDESVTISLYNIGEDDGGEPIELDVAFTRGQLEALVQPLFEKCCDLAIEALSGARLSGSDLNRILLVGGPTQSPLLRALLSARLGTAVDFSVDPMTVVARGAAIYASSLEKAKQVSVSSLKEDGSGVSLKLAYDPVCSTKTTKIAGRIIRPSNGVEIKIDSEGGLWTSGWIRAQSALFEVEAPLHLGEVTTFWVYARDSRGQMLETDVPEFKVRQGLVPSAPPLPHTLSIEIVSPDGKPVLDPIFPKGAPLPLEKTVKYRAKHALVPSDPQTDIAIKLWEGEYFSEPDANTWVGRAILRHDEAKRTIPEGAEIELTIKVDLSRITTMSAFVPHLNLHVSTGKLYVSQQEEQDFASLSISVANDAKAYRERLEELERRTTDEDTRAELRKLRGEINEIDRDPGSSNGRVDPDSAKRAVETSKAIRGKLSRLEVRAGAGDTSTQSLYLEEVESTDEVVNQFGSTLEKQQFALLKRELERAMSRGDNKGAKRAAEEMISLRWRTLFKHDWFWREIFESLCEPGTPYVDQQEARALFAKGKESITNGNGQALRDVVRALWKLQPQTVADETKEKALRSGLRRY